MIRCWNCNQDLDSVDREQIAQEIEEYFAGLFYLSTVHKKYMLKIIRGTT